MSRQDEPNRTLWLAMELHVSFLLRGIRCIPQEKFPWRPCIIHVNPLLTELVWSRWLDIGLVLFCEFMDLDSISIYKHAKQNLVNIQPSWPQTWSITHIYTVSCAEGLTCTDCSCSLLGNQTSACWLDIFNNQSNWASRTDRSQPWNNSTLACLKCQGNTPTPPLNI